MEDFANKLKIAGEIALESLFPNLCHRYETMLEEENFNTSHIPKLRSMIQESCGNLLKSSKSKAKVSPSVQSSGISALKKRKSIDSTTDKTLKKSKPGENQMLVEKICDELVNRGIVVGSSDLSSSVQDILESPDVESNRKKTTSSTSAPSDKRKKLTGRPSKLSHDSSDDDSSDDEANLDIDSDILKSNPFIVKMIEELKPELRNAIDLCQTLNGWIQLHVPKIEDGNNFGVEVQNQIIGEIEQLEADTSIYQKTMSLYFLQRAEIVGHIAKHPEILDFSRALEELDTKQFLALRMITREQRNSCYGLLDLMKKNKEKLLKPRSASHSHSLVY